MNYKRIYVDLIAKGVDRGIVKGYHEKHHIIPKCMSGTNVKSNIVQLTPEEHYIAHLLLCKIYPDNHKLLYAAVHMTLGNNKQKGRSLNKMYGWLKKRQSQMLSKRLKGTKASYISRAKMTYSHLGKKRKPHSAETKTKMSLASLGKKKSFGHCLAMAQAQLGKRGEEGRNHKLTDAIVREIKIELRDKERPMRDIAIAYNIHKAQIEKINRGLLWSHVKI